MHLNADRKISWTSMKIEFLISFLKADKNAFTSMHSLKGELWSQHLLDDEIHFLFCVLEQKHYKKWFQMIQNI